MVPPRGRRRNDTRPGPFVLQKESVMENPRTETARENDDSDIIENAEPAPNHGGSSGGNMQRDIGSEATLERVRDPERMKASTSRTISTTRSATRQTGRATSSRAATAQSSSSSTVTSSPAEMSARQRTSFFTGRK